MSKKIFSGVAAASFIIVFFSLISKGLGFFREIVFANSFGLSKDFDVYLIGSVIPTVVNTGIIYLGQNYFIPSYSKVKARGGDEKYFFNNIFWLFVLLGFIIGSIFFFGSNLIIGLYQPGISEQTKQLAEKIFRVMSLTLPLNSASAIISAYLQAEYEFKTPAVSQLFINISIIILTLIFSGTLNVLIIPLGYLIGMFLQFIYLFFKARGVLKINYFLSGNPSNILSHFSVSLLAIIIIEVISQLYVIADRFFYKQVDVGGIAAMNYAQNLFLLPVGIFSIALSTAILPKLSHNYYNHKDHELSSQIITGLEMNNFISIPISILFIFFGREIVASLYQGGKFTPSDSITTFNVLRIFGISLIFYSAYSVLNKVLYGINAIKFLMIATAGGISLKIFLNAFLVIKFKQDGLALSTTLTYIVFFGISFIYVLSKVKLKTARKFSKDFFISLCNACIAYFITKIFIGTLEIKSNIVIAVSVLFFLTIYATNAYLIKQNSIKLIYSTVINMLYPN